ncbi:MAG: hypothetical protein AAFX46_03990, partial [Cyanobacteria bacterium J06636_27]
INISLPRSLVVITRLNVKSCNNECLGFGNWAWGIGESYELAITNYRCPMPHPLCPISKLTGFVVLVSVNPRGRYLKIW